MCGPPQQAIHQTSLKNIVSLFMTWKPKVVCKETSKYFVHKLETPIQKNSDMFF